MPSCTRFFRLLPSALLTLILAAAPPVLAQELNLRPDQGDPPHVFAGAAFFPDSPPRASFAFQSSSEIHLTLTLVSGDTSDFLFENGLRTLSVTLPPSPGSTYFGYEIELVPTSPGIKNAVVQIDHDAANRSSPIMGTVTGVSWNPGLTPFVNRDPDNDGLWRITFSETPLGLNSDDNDDGADFPIQEKIGATVEIDSIIIVGDHAADFQIRRLALEGDYVSFIEGFTIGPNESHDIGVLFAPTEIGERTATINIYHHNNAAIPLTVELVGTGIEPPPMTLKLGQEYVIDDEDDDPETPGFGAPGDVVGIPLSIQLEGNIPAIVGGLQLKIDQSNPNGAEFIGFELNEDVFGGGIAVKPAGAGAEPGPGDEVGGFTVATSLAENTINVVIYSPEGREIIIFPSGLSFKPNADAQAGNGELPVFIFSGQPLGYALFELDPDDDQSENPFAQLGDTYTLDLFDSEVSDEEGNPVPGVTFQENDEDALIQVGIHGDLSLDGRISILDIIKFVRILIETDQTPDIGSTAYIIADANADGFLLVDDVIEQVNIILDIDGFGGGAKVLAGGPTRPVVVSLGDVQTLSNGATVIPALLDADGMISGAQATFTFDPAMLTVGTPLLTGRAASMSIDSRVKDGKLTVVFYSLQLNGGIAAGAGPVLLIPVTIRDGAQDPSLTVSQVVLADPRAQRAEVAIGVGMVKASAVPATFGLRQNRPNPFNPITQIAYDAPQQAHITLTVYNLLGQEVITLVNEVKPAGRYTVAWNGRNIQGIGVASGVYMYRITTSAGYTETRRMTLLK